MSDFKFPCPKCGQKILCDTSNAGMQIPCPSCQTALTVPPPPPTAPVTAAPGKLSIKHTAPAQHAPPPPGAAAAPPKPVWGAKPAPASAGKKFPVANVLTAVVLIGLLAAGWFYFGAPYFKQKHAEEEQQKQAEIDRLAAEQAKAAAEAAKLRVPKAVWDLDLADVKFPDRPAAGKQHGENFMTETALLQGGLITLRQNSGATRQFVIQLPLKTGETLSGKSFVVTPTNTVNQPKIILNWKAESPKPPGAQTFTKGYAMKLEFGTLTDGRVPAKIYLSLPDPEQSFVAGNFEAGPKALASQPGAAPRKKSKQP